MSAILKAVCAVVVFTTAAGLWLFGVYAIAHFVIKYW